MVKVEEEEECSGRDGGVLDVAWLIGVESLHVQYKPLSLVHSYFHSAQTT